MSGRMEMQKANSYLEASLNNTKPKFVGSDYTPGTFKQVRFLSQSQQLLDANSTVTDIG